MVWCEAKEHFTDCYFCLVSAKGIEKKRQNICYPGIPSAIQPVLHFDEFPPLIYNGFVPSEDEETEFEEEHLKMEYKKNRYRV